MSRRNKENGPEYTAWVNHSGGLSGPARPSLLAKTSSEYYIIINYNLILIYFSTNIY